MLLFDVTGQTLTRKDKFEPATDSVEYLVARFTFKTTDWNGAAKSALFRIGDIVYEKLLDSSGACKVPYEVLEAPTSRYFHTHGSTFNISLVGQNGNTRITTNEIPVKLKASGYGDAETPADPTETMYQQLLTAYADNEAAIQAAQAECETARADLVGVKNLFANGIKGTLSGAVVRADDVSPIEHNPIVKVRGKNLFRPEVRENIVGGAFNYTWQCTATVASDGKITLTNTATSGVAYFRAGSLELKKGKTYIYTLHNLVNVDMRLWWKHETTSTVAWTAGIPFTPTDDMTVDFAVYMDDISTIGNTTSIYVQVEEGTVATAFESPIDPTTVTVSRCGKNLLPNSSQSYTQNGITFTHTNDGGIRVTGTATATTTDIFTRTANVTNGQKYIYSGCPAGGKTGQTYVLRCYNPDGTTKTYDDEGNGVELDFTNADGDYNFSLLVFNGATINTVFRPMLRLADDPNEKYVPYTATTHTPGADGVVTGINTLSPTMTIMTNTDGVTVECEYIRDTNKVIEKIENAIDALSGTT